MKAPRFWQASQPTLLARALQPLGAVYGAITLRRMARTRVDCAAPVICVGNYTAGGAGKTPVAIYVAQLLLARGESVFFLSRGYGGSLGRSDAARVDAARHTASEAGDEPLLLARVAPTIVAADRLAGARRAVEQGASVIVMDDGLQSGGLAHALTLAVIDGGDGFGNGLCLPAGPLRAPVAGQRAHVSAEIIIGAAQAPATGGLPRFCASLQPEPASAALLRGVRVLAFAGIGRPQKFFETLESAGALVVRRLAFGDHHAYRAFELSDIVANAGAQGLTLTTTEKDAARLPADWAKQNQVQVLPVRLTLENDGALHEVVIAAIARARH